MTAVVLVGCGNQNDEARHASACVAAAETAADLGQEVTGVSVAIAALDDRFEPACIEVDQPGRLNIVVRNDGRHPHNLTVDEGSAAAVDAGQVAILGIQVSDAGVRYVCTIHPGMVGEIRVRQADHAALQNFTQH
jgi:plastocyanin